MATRREVDAFWSQVREGSRLVCTDNTYRPAPEGVHTVTRPGSTSVDGRDEQGRAFRLTPPRNVRDVVELTADAITYRIPGRGEHTATWRVLDGGAP